jgi:hypothetical protein
MTNEPEILRLNPGPTHTVWMPRISAFHGIIIWMFYDEHPRPHFHAEYAGFWASIEIDSLIVSKGELPPAQLRKVREWASLHRIELLEDWILASQYKPLKPIEPLI